MELQGILKNRKLSKIYEPDTTKFKLIVWYERKRNGEFYTITEMRENKNRKYHDSIDFIEYKGETVTRHDIAYNKLIDHVKAYKNNILRVWLMFNDFGLNKQYLIGVYDKYNTQNNRNVKVNFEVYNQKNVFATSLESQAIQVFDLKNYFINKNFNQL